MTRVNMGGMVFNTQQTCPECHGKGKSGHKNCPECRGKRILMKKKTLNVQISKGMKEG